MALCVVLQPDGTLTATGEAVADCTGHLLVTPAEYAWLELMQQAFGMPSAEQAATLVAGGLGGVLFIYVLCRLLGAVANFFD